MRVFIEGIADRLIYMIACHGRGVATRRAGSRRRNKMSNTSVAGAPRRASSSPSFASRPLTEHFGVEVVGFDFAKSLDAEAVAQIRDLADTHFVVLFRGQPLSEEQHVAFTAALGEPVLPVESAFSSIKNPTILRLGNVDHDGKHLDA